MSCSDAVDCDSDQMKKDMCRRWKRYDSIGQQNGGGESRDTNSGAGYRCRMAVNPALTKLINSSGEIEGRVRRRNGDITLDLSLPKPKDKGQSSGPMGKLCCISSCVTGGSGKKQQQNAAQQREMDKQRIFRKMDYLECELDAVARKIKKETKKKIQRQKEAEEAAAAAAEEEEEEGEEGEDGGDDGGDDGEDEDEDRPGKFKEVTKTIHKETMINDDGVEEQVTITTKEQVESTGKKQTKTVVTTEEHKTPGGGGFTIVTTEKTVKGGKHNEYKMVKKEKVRSRDDSTSNEKEPKVKHREKTEETTYDDEGKRHEVKTDTTEETKGSKTKTKKIVETKDEGDRGNVIYEKTIVKTQEDPDAK